MVGVLANVVTGWVFFTPALVMILAGVWLAPIPEGIEVTAQELRVMTVAVFFAVSAVMTTLMMLGLAGFGACLWTLVTFGAVVFLVAAVCRRSRVRAAQAWMGDARV
jgi:hypothetical protein